MEPRSVNNTDRKQTVLPLRDTENTPSKKNITPKTETATQIPPRTDHQSSSERQLVSDKINILLDSSDSASAIALAAEVNKTLLSDGITNDQRLVNVHASNKKFSATSATKTQHHSCVESVEDEFFDALVDLEADTPDTENTFSSPKKTLETDEAPPQKSPDEHTTTYASRIFNATKTFTGLTKLYDSILEMAESLLNKFVTGIKGSDINDLLVAMNKVHTDSQPQELCLQKITLPFLDPSYQLSNAKIILHEVSTPDSTQGYKHVRIKITIDADVQYPSPDGTMISGHLQLDNTTFDLNFTHDQFIKQLLTSANIITTVAQTCGSLLYPKMPGLPGMHTIKSWLGWENKTITPEVAPTLKSLLKPRAITLSDVNLHTTLSDTSDPNLTADFHLKADYLAYNPEEACYLHAENTEVSLNGNQCAKLLPFSMDDSLVTQLPFFHYDRTATTITLPQLTVKNELDNQVVIIPQASINTQGDIDIKNGKIEDLRLGLFTQPSGNKVTALRAGKITTDHLHIPAASFNVPIDEQGAVSLEDMNITLITSGTPSKTLDKNLLQQEAPTLLQRLKGMGWGWIYSNAKAKKSEEAVEEKQHEPQKMLTLSAKTINGDLSGPVNFTGQVENFGLQVGETRDIHLHANAAQMTKLHFQNKETQGAAKDSKEEAPVAPLNFSGTVGKVHLKASADMPPGAAVAEVDIDQAKLEISGPVNVSDTDLQQINIKVMPPEQKDIQIKVSATSAFGHIQTDQLKSVECCVDKLSVDTHILRVPTTEQEKAAVEKFWQRPESVVNKTTVDIKAETITANAAPVASFMEALPLIDNLTIENPNLHLEISQADIDTEADSASTSGTVIQGNFNAEKAATGFHRQINLSDERQHVITMCRDITDKMTEQAPELKEALKIQLQRYESSPEEQTPNLTTGTVAVEHPVVEFKHHSGQLDAKTTLPEIQVALAGSAINTQTTVHNTQAKYNSAEGSAELNIDAVKVQQLSKDKTFLCTPKKQDTPVIRVDKISLQQKHNPQTKEKTVQLQVAKLSTDMDVVSGENSQKISLQAAVSKTSMNNTHSSESDKTQLYVDSVNANVEIHNDTTPLNVSLEAKHLCAMAETKKQDSEVACDVEKIVLQAKASNATTQSQIVLKDIGFNAQKTAEKIEICPHINHQESNIALNNLSSLIQQLNQKPADGSKKAFPVRFNLSTNLHKTDELTGTLDVQCEGNIGEIVDYTLSETKTTGTTKMLLSCIKVAGKLFRFNFEFKKLPITKGRISINDITDHLHMTLSFRGRMPFLLRPTVVLIQSMLGIVVRRQISGLNKTDFVDTEGNISVIKFLKARGIHFSQQPPTTPPTTSSHNFDLRAGWMQLRLQQSLPTNWNTDNYHKTLVLELEKTYSKHPELNKDFNDAAKIIAEKYQLPQTTGEFEQVLAELDDIQNYQKKHPEEITPMGFYQHHHILNSSENYE